MKNLKYIIAVIFAAAAFTVSAQDDPMANIDPIVMKASSHCDGPIWGDTDADSVKEITNYSLYREYYKQVEKISDKDKQMQGFKAAMPGWKYMFFNAPKARITTHLNGVTMYKAFYKASTDEVQKEAYLDTMLAIYAVRANCFGNDASLSMRTSFEWYNYRKDGNEVFMFNMFKDAIDVFESEEGTSVYDVDPAFAYPWLGVTYNGVAKKLLTEDDVFATYERIADIAEFNIENGDKGGKWVGAMQKVDDFMAKTGILNCENLIPSAEKRYNEAPDDAANVLKVYTMLKSGKCYDAPFFPEVVSKVVKTNPSAGLYKYLASDARKKGNSADALNYTQKAIEMTTDPSAKASLTLQIARDYEGKGDYSSARTWAYKAADLKSGWGAPYMLVGRLYASSGSKCGPGTGPASQIVTWVAIDEWQKARSIDSSVADEAQRLINKYSAYMPSKQDIFLDPSMTIGSSYQVGCWISRSTTVRAAN